jgi:hypothetical protein
MRRHKKSTQEEIKMKIQRYEVQVYHSTLEYAHCMGTTQQRAYIPEMGVLGYRQDEDSGERTIDFFANSSEAIESAKLDIAGKGAEDVNFLGEYEMPQLMLEQLVKEASAAKKEMDTVKSAYDESLRKLVCLVEYTPKVGGLTK